jgi:carbamoyl-phosphate synthase large subunit
MNVLISGIAGDIGFGAGRILREWGWCGQLIGMDVQAEHPGQFIFDRTAVSPRAKDTNYLNWLSNFIKNNNINLFVPTSEAEILFFSQTQLREINGAKIVIANPKAIAISIDKQVCMNFLSDRCIKVPQNGIVGEINPLKFPVIVKPRSGRGSKDIIRFDELHSFVSNAVNGNVWQEYLTPDDQEYTCPIYSSPNRGLYVLVLRRTLLGGHTGRGEVVNDPIIEEYAVNIARQLELNGAINVQLRLTAEGPCLFEINPRLSSTLVFRDKMGFNDLRWWIQDIVGAQFTPPLVAYQAPTAGTRFFRGVYEYIDFK